MIRTLLNYFLEKDLAEVREGAVLGVLLLALSVQIIHDALQRGGVL